MLHFNEETSGDKDSGKEEKQNTQSKARLERSKSNEAEKSPVLYDKVVIGHSYRDFDRDQFFTYFQARYLGVISDDAPVEFNVDVAEADLRDSRVAVIEGDAKAKNIPFNSIKSGNFDNDPKTDDPAAFKFFEAASNQIIPEAKTKGRIDPSDVDKLN